MLSNRFQNQNQEEKDTTLDTDILEKGRKLGDAWLNRDIQEKIRKESKNKKNEKGDSSGSVSSEDKSLRLT